MLKILIPLYNHMSRKIWLNVKNPFHDMMYGCTDVWMYGCMDVQCTDVWMYGCMYACMYVYTV